MPKRMWAILAIGLGLTLAVLDGGIANVALPTIAREVQDLAGQFDLGGERLSARGDDIAAAACVAGRNLRLQADLQGGLVLFTAASLVSALSTSLPTLILGRMLQGFGAAGDHERQ